MKISFWIHEKYEEPEIVNVKKIRRMDTSIAGTIHMYLQGDIETYVSRRYVSRIRDSLMR